MPQNDGVLDSDWSAGCDSFSMTATRTVIQSQVYFNVSRSITFRTFLSSRLIRRETYGIMVHVID